jgi:hypothetical protein
MTVDLAGQLPALASWRSSRSGHERIVTGFEEAQRAAAALASGFGSGAVRTD